MTEIQLLHELALCKGLLGRAQAALAARGRPSEPQAADVACGLLNALQGRLEAASAVAMRLCEPRQPLPASPPDGHERRPTA